MSTKRLALVAAAVAALLAIPAFIAITVRADLKQQECERGVYDMMGVQVPSIVQMEIAKGRCK